MPWRRKGQPAPVFLPGEPHGQRSLAATVHGVTKSRTRLKRRSTDPQQGTVDREAWRAARGATESQTGLSGISAVGSRAGLLALLEPSPPRPQAEPCSAAQVSVRLSCSFSDF